MIRITTKGANRLKRVVEFGPLQLKRQTQRHFQGSAAISSGSVAFPDLNCSNYSLTSVLLISGFALKVDSACGRGGCTSCSVEICSKYFHHSFVFVAARRLVRKLPFSSLTHRKYLIPADVGVGF